MINLFKHNLSAYESAIEMLAETSKAAIIHPTGTGKSFVAFKLCEDNPKSRILWLSPSEYIFRTQIENLIATGGDEPKNIVFYTYAKLMFMSEAEIAQIEPDYIVLDEFHRCGAEMWGKGVHTVLNTYKDIPLLGLSATNIRYLDNQRDMADELFDGNVASEMTLGEAIVRGILNPPKYVLSVFQYQKDLDKYAYRVKHAKSKAVRDEGEKYLEALRRALEKADGLPEIFNKHIPSKNGKYIVFCANVEHLNEMSSHVDEWFGAIDDEPHVYRAYSDDPATSKAFAEFKNRGKRKLTERQISLLEDIGIDWELGKGKLSKSAWNAQYEEAKAYYERYGNLSVPCGYKTSRGTKLQIWIVRQRKAYTGGELSEEQIQKLEAIGMVWEFADAWEVGFTHANEYRQAYGNLLVSHGYVCSDGYRLGIWIANQRNNRDSKDRYRRLSVEQIERLDSIGMIWNVAEYSWDRAYEIALRFWEQHGHIRVPRGTMSGDVNLQSWVCEQRRKYKQGKLSQDKILKLMAIGVITLPDIRVSDERKTAAVGV